MALKPLAVLSFCFRKHGASPGSLLREVFLVPSSYLGGGWGGQAPPTVSSPLPLLLPPPPTRTDLRPRQEGPLSEPCSGHGPPDKMKSP